MTRVGVIGVGQVGTMLGMALRAARHAPRPHTESTTVTDSIVLFDADRSVAEESLARGAGDRIAASAEEALDSDTIILALSVPTILRFLGEHGGKLRPGTFLIDTGSAKTLVVECMRATVSTEAHPIGGHPLVGTERPGPGGARPELLRDAPFVLTPVREDPEALHRGRALALSVGANPVVVGAAHHDRVVALTSHLPHVAAFALSRLVERAQASDALISTLASTGLRDATRLAASDPRMVAGFLWGNCEEVRRAAGAFGEALDELVAALADGPEGAAHALAGGLEAQSAATNVNRMPEALGEETPAES